MQRYADSEYPLQKESFLIIGICMEVHRILGRGLLEIVYKDAIEYEFKAKKFHLNVKRSMKLNTHNTST